MYQTYFHDASEKAHDETMAWPTVMRTSPVRISGISLPQRDMTVPEMRPPRGMASEGRDRRMPALVAESWRMAWKKSGSMKRY